MRNNFEDRLEQVRKQASNEVVPQAAQTENFLSFVNPVEVVDLPSKGKFYPDGHPLKDKEYIEIRQMTAKEEDILTNKSLIRKGLMIDKLIESLLVDKSIPVSSILVGDKNAIMVAARIAAYGPSYDVIVDCKECAIKNTLSIDLTEVVSRQTSQIISEMSGQNGLNAEQLENGTILVQLPRTGWIVQCRLMTGVEERKVISMIEQKKRIDPNGEVTTSEQLEIIIASINAVYDDQVIREAIKVMPAYDAKYLRSIYQKMIPNVRIEKRYVCSFCSEEQELEVPFTQEFFWPK